MRDSIKCFSGKSLTMSTPESMSDFPNRLLTVVISSDSHE